MLGVSEEIISIANSLEFEIEDRETIGILSVNIYHKREDGEELELDFFTDGSAKDFVDALKEEFTQIQALPVKDRYSDEIESDLKEFIELLEEKI